MSSKKPEQSSTLNYLCHALSAEVLSMLKTPGTLDTSSLYQAVETLRNMAQVIEAVIAPQVENLQRETQISNENR